MNHLPELMALYAAMTPWARTKLIETARDYAAAWPAPKKIASLTLIQGTTPTQIFTGALDSDANKSAPVLVR